MPGVFAFGNFDTWTPGYLMFMAATHNGISRLYETFGNGGSAETLERTLSPDRDLADLVPPEPAAAPGEVVAPQQQQLRADRVAGLALLHREQQAALPAEFLREEQALDPEGAHRGTGGLRAHRRHPPPRRAGRAAARVTEAARGDLARDGSVHRDCPRSREAADGRRTPTRVDARVAGHGSGRPKTESRSVPGRQLHRPDGPALLAHRRRAARLPVLEPQRSAEDAVRRHRLDLPRGLRGRGGAGHRPQGARRPDGAGQARRSRAGRRERRGHRVRDQSQRRQRPGHAALPAQGGRLPDRGGALRGGGPEIQPRDFPDPRIASGRPGERDTRSWA